MNDSIVSVYSDTRSEYTKQLCIFLVPAYFQFFVDLLAKVKQGIEPKKVLWQFQTSLNEVHDWNMEKVHNEIALIHTNTGCDYLEDLLTAVFIAHTKVLTAIRLSANNKKIEITIPKVEHFLFKVLCEISKLLWSSTYLFREDISGVDRQQNYKAIEVMIGEGILQAIRSLVPVKSILKNLVNQEEKTEKTDEDSDDEEVQVAKPSLIAPKNEPTVEDAPIIQEPKVDESVLAPLESITLAPVAPVAPVAPELISVPEPVAVDSSPQIINLDEKPSVSFAKFNTLFSSENPDESNMIDADDDKAPDLEILDGDSSALSADDFDDLQESGNPLGEDDFDELP
jgi:hypothetical protein